MIFTCFTVFLCAPVYVRDLHGNIEPTPRWLYPQRIVA